MKVYDISMTIHEGMAVYKNKEEKKPKIINRGNFSTGSAYESAAQMDLHTGTHIDSPLHMIENGETMDLYPIDRYIADAKVIDLTHVEEAITKDNLINEDIQRGDFLLFKTRNSLTEEFDFNFVYLEKTGAEYLATIGVQGVGTDALGIERAQPDHETHKALLGKGIMIIEGLRLKDIKPGKYKLICLPIKILETEAAPARAILIDESVE